MEKFEFYDEHFVAIATHPDYAWQFADCYEAWVPEGWDELTKDLCDKINEIVPEEFKDRFTWKQFKQKFGGLRAYSVFGRINAFREPIPLTEDERKIAKAINDAIDEAEQKSHTICETCSKPGKTMTVKWYITTRCEEHSKER